MSTSSEREVSGLMRMRPVLVEQYSQPPAAATWPQVRLPNACSVPPEREAHHRPVLFITYAVLASITSFTSPGWHSPEYGVVDLSVPSRLAWVSALQSSQVTPCASAAMTAAPLPICTPLP